MNLKINLANPANYGGTRSKIEYIVVHYTANDGDTDEANANYFKNNIVKASAHYFVDDNSVTQSVPENRIAYSVGGAKYSNTKGGSFYRKCTNANSISVELCDTKRNGKYDFTEATLNNAIELIKELMNKYNIPIERVIRHYDITGKICPKPFVENEQAWINFKARLLNADKYICYQTYCQNIGWQEPSKENGQLAGTEGQSLRIEAIKIDASENIKYRVHMENKGNGDTKGGWSEYVPNGFLAGTMEESRRIECIEIETSKTPIKATAHIQNIGTVEYAPATHLKIGTEGQALRLEALTLKFV